MNAPAIATQLSLAERAAGVPAEKPADKASALVVGVIGAGTMGAGIAQIAAAAGHTVRVHDARDGAAAEAVAKLGKTFGALVAKGKMPADAAADAVARLMPAASLAELADCGLVVEAIVERLDVKNALFRELEAIVAPDAILATNTSSISVTAIARGLAHPERVAGLHFFNPVPLMKLVEVVSGLATAPDVADRLHALAGAWGKTAVRARSTPGFIVNRIARPFYAEALLLLQEQRATPDAIDAALRSAGFRMGPCELMDLIGHDVNFAVTSSVFEAFHADRRFVPSIVQRELVDGGMLGRKTGQGFYRYGEGGVMQAVTASAGLAGVVSNGVDAGAANGAHPESSPAGLPARVVVRGGGELAERLATSLHAAGCMVVRDSATATSSAGAAFAGVAAGTAVAGGEPVGVIAGSLRLWLTDGRPAAQRAADDSHPPTAVFDLPLATPAEGRPVLAVAFAPACSAEQRALAGAVLAAAGFDATETGDAPGLIVARTVAMLVNEAADAVQQGVCSAADADTAMKLGTNYPAGPFEWLARLGVGNVVGLLDAIGAATGSERYRVSPWLRERAWAGRAAA
ncbi:3-hydroxyacyl-CoA dehydrogenase NAD-binding domain-containing protein [Derxia gummosa]|uniref:3-hydroxyacyl-CoA dehydrogenase NAD-binding domain-containing protein n=1 Tax=Derxia gummosa DSM 723 TaxID=1121388 RepID=A0A8B6XBC8_9BURK|nr:3-hydroxyacyl-CoA dehydrogenase NAD-binding domain-containing protein [Derxia gummosa]